MHFSLSLRHLKRKLFHPHGDASTPGGSMGQDGSSTHADTSTLSSVSTARGHSISASKTSIDGSVTQPPHVPAAREAQSELESRLQPNPAPVDLDHALLRGPLAIDDTHDKSASLPERLWDRAYDDLKMQETAMVQAYEKILTRTLYGPGLESDSNVDAENRIAQDNPGTRRAQMEQLVGSGIAKITREAKIKDNLNTGVQVIMSAKDIISSAIQTIPQAALAWTGVCVALEILGNPISATEANRNGIQYVIERMKWYWALPDAILKKNTGAYSLLSGLNSEIEIQLISLYKALLLYQIKSVCLLYKNRGLVFLRDIVKLDNWDSDIKAIQEAEASFYNDSTVYREEKMNANLEQLVTCIKEQMTKEDGQCFKDLGVTDPTYDKKRIEKTKGGLLEDSYRWILDNPDFQQWRHDKERRLLWIKGEPGKGKTMLLCGIANELNKPTTYSGLVSFFFCQATDQRINKATAVLWGLMFMLVDQQPSLMSHIRKKYDTSGKELFTGVNTWIALSEIFSDMLGDPALTAAYLLIDALDECVSDRDKLLDFIVENLSTSSCVKWIVSSRNWPEIERRLAQSGSIEKTSLSLEVNADLVSRAVDAYIEHEISQLILMKNHPTLKAGVRSEMRQKANGTFLWVALVIKELRDRQDAEYEDPSNILNILIEMPSDLTALYSRMVDHIGKLEGDAPKLCLKILSIATLAYRPLSLVELGTLANFGSHLTNGPALERLVNKCGSFLTIRDRTVYFIHQSAKDHLTTSKTTQSTIFPSGHGDVHSVIFSHSLQAMGKTLRTNIYDLLYPGFPTNEIETPDPDPLAAIRYSCTYWVDHLCEGTIDQNDLGDSGAISLFLHKHFLHWLEALSILQTIWSSTVLIAKLKILLETQSRETQLYNFVQDAHRFVLHNQMTIEIAPLQTYSSALIFSPMRSLIREVFREQVPYWMGDRLIVDDNWGPCLQTLDCHNHYVISVDFFADTKQVVLASNDHTVKIWDISTGIYIQSFKGHSAEISSVAFSGDGTLASGSHDNTVRIWDIVAGTLIQTLYGHSEPVNSVAFSGDGKLASGSHDNTVRIWDIVAGTLIRTLYGHSEPVNSVAFSGDGKLASGSNDKTVGIWDIAAGTLIQTLNGHSELVNSVAFSGDGKLASGSDDYTVKIWDIAAGACVQTLKGHSSRVTSVAFSIDSKQVASGSLDETVRIWDIAAGACIQTLKGHSNYVKSVAFSRDSKQVASGLYNSAIKIWDIAAGACIQTLEGHGSWVRSVAFSRDSKQVASGSHDKTVKIWDIAAGTLIQTLNGHSEPVNSVAFSGDGKLASGSNDKTVGIWDIAAGACIQTLEGHSDWVRSVAFSRDSKQVASGSDDKTVRIWDIAAGACIQTLEGHSNWVRSVAFSGDSKQVASGSFDETVKIWDIAAGACIQTLEGHSNWVGSVAFSGDSKQVASGSFDEKVRIWDIATGVCVKTLYVGVATQLSFDQRMKSRLYTNLGALDLDLEPINNLPLTKVSLQPSHYGYGIDGTGVWIVKDGKPMLWLPPEYRPERSAVAGSVVVIGCRSHRVLVMQFLE
ncbi:WD40-repeat-containing domain protein [Trichoderma ceciliae]